MKILKRVGLVLFGGLALHLVALAALLWSGGLVMDGFDTGSAVPVEADVALGFVRSVWFLAFLLPDAAAGSWQHVAGFISATAWVFALYLVGMRIRGPGRALGEHETTGEPPPARSPARGRGEGA